MAEIGRINADVTIDNNHPFILHVCEHIVQVAHLRVRSHGIGAHHEGNVLLGKVGYQAVHNGNRRVQRVTRAKNNLIDRIVLSAEHRIARIGSLIDSTQWYQNRYRLQRARGDGMLLTEEPDCSKSGEEVENTSRYGRTEQQEFNGDNEHTLASLMASATPPAASGPRHSTSASEASCISWARAGETSTDELKHTALCQPVCRGHGPHLPAQTYVAASVREHSHA